ncbi:DNA (cytosine-5)-methyltransferase CMT3-like isoform X3 [Nicotiana tabacum]|uniref:DNA (cytosine-5-)-methyltransferase n=2 Tax=Nicotiana TaxID=4085 RepID=A0A1S4DIQ4_TOBAC|nr:PREDICTED: DNA (cytosine-5)-methyltransferase CMT3-like isoform X3 [Nicotiana sylvestris]XP_016513164.1 PREDICTED: DNA (cytosine-5)-methyltransferase CMT3-like isoform X4 [Nicotiana tabacum]
MPTIPGSRFHHDALKFSISPKNSPHIYKPLHTFSIFHTLQSPPLPLSFGGTMPSKRKASTPKASTAAATNKKSKGHAVEKQDPVVEPASSTVECDFVEDEVEVEETECESSNEESSSAQKVRRATQANDDQECEFSGDSISHAEAMQKWPHRYINHKDRVKANGKPMTLNDQDDADQLIQAKCHFAQAVVDGQIYNLGDDAYVQASNDEDDYICKIVEFFQAVDGMQYFTAQWFYRAKDTVIKAHDQFINNKRVFFSEIKDDNPLGCLVKKIKIVPIPSNVRLPLKESLRSNSDYYYDMMYLLPYSSFVSLPQGCGAMSTGLCLGADIGGVKLVTKWAVDLNQYACDSLKWNHPETAVRNESADDFLLLLREWRQLCASCSLLRNNTPTHPFLKVRDEDEEDNNDNGDEDEGSGDDEQGEIFEVEELLEICYGDPKEINKPGLYFKVRWKGYGQEEDTWEPIEGLDGCQEKIKDFVAKGFKASILPLPGEVEVICGGPPCQGVSGFNRFRNSKNPLGDSKNKQLETFMDIVEFLNPRFVLMENVVDLVKFADGFLGRYALGRLVGMNYQTRMGMMVAGAYGLPQFRRRVFMWGALPSEKLPQYPLPTHNVVVRGGMPKEFELNVVAYDEALKVELKRELFLKDAISDLPPVENDEPKDEMPYIDEPKSAFQHFIRSRRDGTLGSVLYDHRPLRLNEDDYERVCQIPKRKGANFRDLPGVRVRANNTVELDPDVERVKVASGKPLVPDYAITFVRGTSTKPFGRLWWDEIVPTVVTRAEPHNQVILHPEQDRVLTIRENARLQGLPDYYKLTGPIKERYMQVGNAVAVPVARALGYSLALAMEGLSGEKPLLSLPPNFPCLEELGSNEESID